MMFLDATLNLFIIMKKSKLNTSKNVLKKETPNVFYYSVIFRVILKIKGTSQTYTTLFYVGIVLR